MFGTLLPSHARLAWRRPFGDLDSLRAEMDETLSRFYGDEDNGWLPSQMPHLDMSETETALEVHLDVPGFDADDIEVQTNGEILTVHGKQEEEKKEEGKKYHRVERRRGSFSRSVRLPCPVDEENVNAEYADGVLTVTLPKVRKVERRKIKVKT